VFGPPVNGVHCATVSISLTSEFRSGQSNLATKAVPASVDATSEGKPWWASIEAKAL